MTPIPLSRRLALALGLAAALASPHGARPAMAETPDLSVGRLTGQAWRVVEIDGAPAPLAPPLTLEVSAEGDVSGASACNSFTASATLDAGTLALGPMRTTRRACPAPVMALERAYLAALARVAAFEIDAGRLTLRDADGAAVLRLER